MEDELVPKKYCGPMFVLMASLLSNEICTNVITIIRVYELKCNFFSIE